MASRPLCQVLYVSCIISPITGFCLYHNFLYMICMLLDNKDYFIVIVIVIVMSYIIMNELTYLFQDSSGKVTKRSPIVHNMSHLGGPFEKLGLNKMTSGLWTTKCLFYIVIKISHYKAKYTPLLIGMLSHHWFMQVCILKIIAYFPHI